MVACQSMLLKQRRSNRPSATSPDVAWTTVTSELPSKTDTLTQLYQLRHSWKVEEDEEQSNKQSCLDEGTVAKETKIAEEDEDSEPSSDEEVEEERNKITSCSECN